MPFCNLFMERPSYKRLGSWNEASVHVLERERHECKSGYWLLLQKVPNWLSYQYHGAVAGCRTSVHILKSTRWHKKHRRPSRQYRTKDIWGWTGSASYIRVSNTSAGLISRRFPGEIWRKFSTIWGYWNDEFNLNEEACGDRPHLTPITVSSNTYQFILVYC